MPPRAEHAQSPARLGAHVRNVAQGELGRRRQPVDDVLVALPQNLQVKGKHQCGTLRRLGAVDQAADVLAIAHHVELEPERFIDVLGHILDRADAHCRQRKRHTEFFGRARREDLAIGVLHAGQADGRKRHGHGEFLAGHRALQAAVFHVDRNPLAQLDARKVRGVLPIRGLGPRTRIGIIVEHARHTLFSQDAQVFHAGDWSLHHDSRLGVNWTIIL